MSLKANALITYLVIILKNFLRCELIKKIVTISSAFKLIYSRRNPNLFCYFHRR